MDYKKIYIDFLKKKIDIKKPLTVVFDASNGPAGMIVKGLWEGTLVRPIIINDNLDPDFKAHGPNPLLEGASNDCTRMIKEHGADIGVIFDADGDRAIFVDDQGIVVPSCFIAALMFKETKPPYVADELVYQSLRMLDIIPENDILPSRIGARFIKERMRNDGGTIGAENSGHYYFKEFFNADSGIFSAIMVLNALSKMNQSISAWKKQFAEHTVFTKEIKIEGKDMAKILAVIEQRYKTSAKHMDKRDGLTLVFDTAWFNIRASNTEPILRIIAGGSGDMQKKAKEIEVFI